MKKILLNNAKNLRKSQNEAERALWKHLSKKQFNGCKFKRKHAVGDYVVDFVLAEKKLIIELNCEKSPQNFERDRWFYKKGYEVLRIWDNEIYQNKHGVLEAIRNLCN